MLCTLKLTNFLIRTNCHKEAIELGLIRWPNHMGLGVIKLQLIKTFNGRFKDYSYFAGVDKQCGKSPGTLSIFGKHIKLDYLD